MCGRFSLANTNLKTEYDAINNLNHKPRFNIAPSSQIPVVITKNGKNFLEYMHWGFNLKFGDKNTLLINARSETLEEKRTFKPHLEQGRCLVPATGFYEWKKTDNGKIPQYIFLPDRTIFAFAGLYREINPGEFDVTILTINPNKLMKEIHNRMPVILKKGDEQRWLSDSPYNDVCDLLTPYPAEEMQAYSVSKKVNSPSNDSPDLVDKFSYELDI